nr:deSI-like protein At4g17486 [Ipomoea batatas]
MWCKTIVLSRKRKTGAVPVYLNVYDLTPINGYAYWFGLGVYHSGVQVHGVEYGFGAHEHSTTGIFEVEPKQCPGFTFRKSILIGRTDLGPKEVRAFMEKLAEEYSGNSYNLITKNCNHFCNDVCSRLTGKPIPRWVNRLARLAGLNETKVRHVKAEDRLSDKKKLRSHSSRFVNSSNTNIMPPCPTRSATSNRRQRSRNSPSMSLIRSASTSPSTMRV